MIDTLLWIKTDNTFPYKNLAVEEYLTMKVEPGQCILYLWQNRQTVVIGKNQNCWKECNVEKLEKDGGYLVRRLSGGGAVFHDLGNLNFTFCVRQEDYDLDKQLKVILEAMELLGINAEKTGRNDITVEGRKFSGNAFLRIGNQCYHHGTLMINVDTENMAKYLNVDKSKLASKGVDSVKSRVASLVEFKPDLTVKTLCKALITSFQKVYKLKATEIKESDLPESEIDNLMEKFSSWEWKYGRKIPFQKELSNRFDWGDIQLQINVNQGYIKDINYFSDAMEQAVITLLANSLKGCKFSSKEMCLAVDNVKITEEYAPNTISEIIKNNLKELISSSLN